MNLPRPIDMQALARKIKANESLEKEIQADLRRAFPVGCAVRWRHGHHWRSGIVRRFDGELFGLDCSSFRIETASGCIVDIHWWRVFEGMK